MDARETDLLTAIDATVLVGDGAMGTYLHSCAAIPLDRCFPEQNLSNPQLVERVHTEYFDAGARVLRTNTYRAHRVGLQQFGLEGSLRKINIHGARLARQATNHRAWILGSLGPIGHPLRPVGRISFADAVETFREQAEYLAEGGVDAIVVETISSLHEMRAAIEGTRAACDLPLIALKTFTEDGVTLMGEFPGEVVDALTEMGADIIGANCSLGPHGYAAIIKRMSLIADLPLAVFPTAGVPHHDGTTVHYPARPEYVAEFTHRFADAGVRLVGGCCGYTPEHIAAIAAALAEREERPAAARHTTMGRVTRFEAAREHEELTERSRLSQRMGTDLVVTCEMDVPRGYDMSALLEGARYLHRHGVDALNVSDGARARLRLHPMVVCQMIEQQVGIETIMHYACRDRNVIGMQSEILGAAAAGLRNILVVTGDPTAIGDYPRATSVFEVDSIGLTRIVSGLNTGRDLAGSVIGKPTSFYIAVAANPMAENMDEEIRRLRRKADAGAHCVFTQPIFEFDTLARFLDHTHDLHLPVTLGVLPLRTARHAEFLHNEVPGIDIPKPIRDRMLAASAGSDGNEEQVAAAKRAQAQEGVAVAVELVEAARSMVAGIYLMPPFERYEMVTEIMAGAGIERPALAARG